MPVESDKVRVGKDGKVYRWMRRLYSNQDLYEGEFVDGLKHGRGSLVFSRGDRYNGEFERDLFHGYGVFIWKPAYDDSGNYVAGRRYDGEWKNGKFFGSGIMQVGNGDTYTGMFERNHYHGKGILRKECGDILDGEWIRGKADGFMKIKYINGDLYEGHMQLGEYHGQGRLLLVQGKGEYDGEWSQGLQRGQGTRIFSNGNKFVGQFAEGELDGEGIMFYANGDQYIGHWKVGYPHGKGVLRYNRGDKYEGTFLKGFIYGEGKYQYTDGGYYTGEYRNTRINPYSLVDFPEADGKRHGFGVRVWANGAKYQGQWDDDKMNGKGVYTTVEGGKYEGSFWNGFKHGDGVEDIGNLIGLRYVCPMGHRHNGTAFCKYVGKFDRGCYHGYGEFTCQDGRAYKGYWVRGERHGKGNQYYLRDGDAGDSQRLFIGGIGSLYRIQSYTGQWEGNVRHGFGEVTYVNGDKIEGVFCQGQPSGICQITFGATGRVRYARFERGLRVLWLDDAIQKMAKMLKGIKFN